ncbi:MAG: 3,4-dihydroxy-2-butanone-4-phosphate synthase [Chloroflexi bacterium 13_1_20CM_2_59_7]|nr:MAG: 3,4-dihydroxy-2-butanone-4-phosphate synthase [Chloroflexi bacterium 13_1_20CM_2_59_7]
MTLHSAFTDVPTAIEEIRAGRMIVVVDDEDRENEGDLTLAAEKVTPEAINFMAKYGRGLVCLALTEERLDHLRIGPMTTENTSNYGTAFCEAIDARDGVTTGISAYDRARTIKIAIDPATRPADLARPGHVFPLRARKGGVLVRAGQTEASVDLARLAGLIPAGVICEIMRDDGTMARVPDLIEFCQTHNLKMLTVAELIRYRMQHERYVHRVGEAVVGTRHGEFRLIAYESEVDGGESHVALVRGDLESGSDPVLVRMHSHCLMGDVFGSTGCDCRATIEGSMQAIAREGRGALIYLHQTSKGFSVERIGDRIMLAFHREKRLPALPESERRTQREIGLGAQILSDLNLRRIRLLTNHPRRVAALEGFGIEIVEQVPVALEKAKADRT